MEYIYAVMLLNKTGQTVDEKNVTAVLKAAGVEADAAKVKSLIAALDGVDIATVIEESSFVSAGAPAASGSSPAAAAEETPKEEKKEEAPSVDASAGLGALF